MARRIGCWTLAAGLAAAPLAASANDSTAELATGGLVLTHNAAIEMRSEDLAISDKEVRVDYRFFNTSPQDVTVTVAFPMPDITTEGYDDVISIPTEDPVNFLGFSTTVDGQPVRAEVEQKVFKNGVDETGFLRSLGVPLAPQLQSTDRALDALPQATRDKLVTMHLAVVDEYDVGHGMEKHWEATWTLKTTYYWRQTFPAGREVRVEHRYQPSVGGSAGTQWGSSAFIREPGYARARAHYCVDNDFLSSVRKTIPAGMDYSTMQEERIEYVLVTGANWKAPIGDFHMTIDKGAPANLVSFCGTGVKKTSPTTFEVRYSHFTPTRNVSVLILKPLPAS